MNSEILVLLLIAHVVGDFYLQTDKTCDEKKEKHAASKHMWLHSAAIALVSWLLIWDLSFWWCCLVIMGTHVLIDIVKSYLNSSATSFFFDQFIHIAVIVFIAFTFMGGEYSNPLASARICDINTSWLVLAVLFLFKPANIITRQILQDYKIIGPTDNHANIKDTGALIGSLERILTLCFVLLGQYEAIGFVIAAKSLLRFKDNETVKTEYVLAGTLLSFGMAILVGVILKIGCKPISQ